MRGKSVFVHPRALVESRTIGSGTRVWAFAHVMAGARVGRDCNIGGHCFIEQGAVIGDRVTIKNYVAVWNGVRIEDDAFIGPQASLTNDRWPRSRNPDYVLLTTDIRRGATVGANATLLGGITIGRYAFIGAGGVVTTSVLDHELVVGNPARHRGWVCRCACPLTFHRGRATCPACHLAYVQRSGRIQCLSAAAARARRLLG